MNTRARPVSMKPLDERESLRRWLDFQRGTLVHKVEGLDADGLAFTPVGSGTSLGGLVRHMVKVEDYWFQVTLRGGAVPHRWNDPWQRDDEVSGDELIAIYQEVCESSRVVECTATSLDQLAVGSVAWANNAHPSLRWIMNHMIEEGARHNGHADLLREMVDGSVGM
jgi:uncharacterized damage-inducible protein DinB